MAMPPERVTHAIQFLTGEVHGLFMFAQVLAKSHPDPQRLLSEVTEIEQLGLGSIESLPISDAVIEGFRYAVDGVRKAAKAAQGSR